MNNTFAICHKCNKKFLIYEKDELYFDINVEGNSVSTCNLCSLCAMKKMLANERIFHIPSKTVYIIEN